MAKRILKVNPVLGTDESGKPVIFTVPFAALWHGTSVVTIHEEDRLEDKTTKLFEQAIEMEHSGYPLLETDDDKMDLIKRLKRTGKWLK